MNTNRRLWRWLGLIFVLSFGTLGYLGWQIYLTAPPIPKAVVSSDGNTLFTGEQIQRGQQAWMAAGGQQLGTVWGHGSYVAPDWSADWLHREALASQRAKLEDASLTPSARVLQSLNEDKLGFFAFARRQSERHAAWFRSRPLESADEAAFEKATHDSLAAQAKLEREQQGSFDEYVARYMAAAAA